MQSALRGGCISLACGPTRPGVGSPEPAQVPVCDRMSSVLRRSLTVPYQTWGMLRSAAEWDFAAAHAGHRCVHVGNMCTIFPPVFMSLAAADAAHRWVHAGTRCTIFPPCVYLLAAAHAAHRCVHAGTRCIIFSPRLLKLAGQGPCLACSAQA